MDFCNTSKENDELFLKFSVAGTINRLTLIIYFVLIMSDLAVTHIIYLREYSCVLHKASLRLAAQESPALR